MNGINSNNSEFYKMCKRVAKMISFFIVLTICFAAVKVNYDNEKYTANAVTTENYKSYEFRVDGDSMYPTLEDMQMIKGDEVDNNEISIDDIIIFPSKSISYSSYNIEYHPDYNLCLKEQIGLKRKCVENDIIYYPANKKIEEEFLVKRVVYIKDVNDDGYNDFYVRGDNRINSTDSKDFGYVLGGPEGIYVVE